MKNILNTSPLSSIELKTINGGEDGRYIPIGSPFVLYFLKGIYEFTKQAAEFQASLPPNLKK